MFVSYNNKLIDRGVLKSFLFLQTILSQKTHLNVIRTHARLQTFIFFLEKHVNNEIHVYFWILKLLFSPIFIMNTFFLQRNEHMYEE